MPAPTPVLPAARPLLITQLTALWALSEAVLGGVLHGLNLPITGLVVGGVAVVLVCLIGYYSNRRGDIIKATLVVCIIKATLSPHTPLPAYLAVLFQGGAGALLVSGRRWFRVRCVVFGVVALVESALQKLLVLTLLFGLGFWDAADQFISKLIKPLGAGAGPYGYYIVAGYLGLHVLAGAAIGALAGRLPRLVRSVAARQEPLALPALGANGGLPAPKLNARHRVKNILLAIWLVLVALLVQAWWQPTSPWLPAGKALWLIMRSATVVLAWYLLVGPLLLRVFRRWLAHRQGPLAADVEAVLTLMPVTLGLVRQCWAATASELGITRMRVFLGVLAVHLFPQEPPNEPSQ